MKSSISGESGVVENATTTRLGYTQSPATLIGILAVSLLYFVDIFIRSSHKLFWYDELFTVHLCALPTFKATWHAVLQGADFNPPLFYLLTRVSQAVFGRGLVATRLPASVGVWIFGLCLFLFVSRRVGPAAGSIAGLFPVFTLAQYYAYEARPTGLVLGWCGLALKCWQRGKEPSSGVWWKISTSLALTGAALSHFYAIYIFLPFALAELYSIVESKKIDFSMIGAILAPGLVAIPFYVPLLRQYRRLFAGISGLTESPLAVFQTFLADLAGPALAIIFIALVCFTFQRLYAQRSLEPVSLVPVRELVLAAGFALLPLVGIAGVIASKGIFFDRYFLPSVSGWAVFMGLAASGARLRSWSPGVLSGVMGLFLAGSMAVAVRHAAKHSDFNLIEPSSSLQFSADVRDPMLRHATLKNPPDGLDILLLRQVDYLYLLKYAPKRVASRIYDGAEDANNLTLKAYRILGTQTKSDFKTATIDEFLSEHNRFLLYEGGDARFQAPCGACSLEILRAGFKIVSEARDAEGILYQYERIDQSERLRP